MKRGGRRGKTAMLRFDSVEDMHERIATKAVRDAWSNKQDNPLEKEILPAVIEAIRMHPRIAFAQRVNKGFGRLQRRDGSLSPPFFWAFKDAVDITAMTRDGLRVECEVKRKGEYPEDHQQAFLDAVNGAGGIGFVARCVEDVYHERALGPPHR